MNEILNVTHDEIIKDNIDKLMSMSITEIDAYGSDIQKTMCDESSNILKKANMVDLGDSRDKLDELSDVAKKQKKMLPILQTPLRKIKRLSGNFTKIQSKIDEIGDALEIQRQRIEEHLEYMQEQTNNLDKIIKDLRIHEDSLKAYSEVIVDDEDQTRIQAVVSRMRMLNDTRIIAEQAQAEALMIICEQREAKTQLEQVIRNALPAIQIQAVNSVGIRVNKETQDIISKTREITGQILVQNATDVKNMAVELQNNRTKSIVDEDKLSKAQDILNEAIEIVMKAAEQETSTNLNIINNLSEKAKDNKKSLDILSKKVGDYNNDSNSI